MRLGDIYRNTFSSGLIIQKCLEEISQKTGETVSFYIRDGQDRICLYREHSKGYLRTHVEIGARIPLRKGGAGGKVIRAFTDRIISNGDLKKIREQRYCISVGEIISDAASIAFPVFIQSAFFTGVFVIPGAKSRFTENRRMEVLTLAKEIMKNHNLSVGG